MARRPQNSRGWLLFIDTNILLDFYRLSGDSAVRQLKALERHKDALILTDQVWMEFLKNRQKVIKETVKQLKKPDNISFPPFLSEYQASKTVSASVKLAIENFKKVQKKIDNIISNPSVHDDVYKGVSKLFSHKSSYTLDRDGKNKNRIRSLARKRFILGYPPRKSTDTSVGDAVNWEWIVQCAINCPEKRNVLIISRDNDYGLTQDNEGHLNDWLVKEFKERVSIQRKVLLSPKLTLALKKLNEKVPREDEREEAEIIATFKKFRTEIVSDLSLEELRKKFILGHEAFGSIDDASGAIE